MEIHGSYKVQYHPAEDNPSKVFEVNFTPPFRRVSMVEELEKQLGVTFPPATTFDSPGEIKLEYMYMYAAHCTCSVMCRFM